MVDDGAVFREIYDLHGDELGAEGQDIEFSPYSFVLVHHLRDGLPLHTPPRELEDGHTILLGLCGCTKKRLR